MTVSSSQHGDSLHQGWVESTIREGELFLEDAGGKLFRLTWQPSETDQRRVLLAGRYKVRGYRIKKKDDLGTEWHISVSSAGFQELDIRPQQVARVDIAPTISMACQVRREGQELRVLTPVRGEGDSGLTIYRQGKRIPLGYRLTDDHGETVHSGAMRYG